MKKYLLLISFVIAVATGCSNKKNDTAAIVLQTDFSTKDTAVASMYGVALTVDPNLRIYDLTHEIPTFNIWEAALRLSEIAKYWPEGTIFVSVVDPGVGTDRKSVVLKTTNNYYFVTPDNGSLTFVADTLGVAEVREIDESINRRANSEESYTFHGRDVYVYTAAKLAAKKITFEQVGQSLGTNITHIDYTKPKFENGTFYGNIPILDIQYGNIWTSLPRQLMIDNGIKFGDTLSVKIYNDGNLVWSGDLPLLHTFGEVAENENMCYFNSQLNFSIAINMGNFAEKYNISSGPKWSIEISKKDNI